MSSEISIRFARESDLDTLVDIYNYYIENTAITFDMTPFKTEQRVAWFREFSEDGLYRLLVAERDEKLIGYASSSNFKSRAAYDTSVETTIYLDREASGGGVGTALYAELLRLLVADERLHRAYGVIALPNDASVALHQKFGFVNVGTLGEVGFKLGRYWDVAWYEKDLSR
ncbi:MAG: N-acetyltransferase [Woeseiaceae bacterium]|nr:N-acetyltransferase [Woeseiaceae bacterium]